MAKAQIALDFERPLIALESKIAELKELSGGARVDFTDEISKLERKAKRLQAEIFSDLSRWQIVQLSRHGSRPYFLDYVQALLAWARAEPRLVERIFPPAVPARRPKVSVLVCSIDPVRFLRNRLSRAAA